MSRSRQHAHSAKSATGGLPVCGLLLALAWLPVSAAATSPATIDELILDCESEQADDDCGFALAIESKTERTGHYRLIGEGQVDRSPQETLAILTAFDHHCAEGCRWPISSLDQIEIVEAEKLSPGQGATGVLAGQEAEIGAVERFVTWTRIDDFMDASYFQVAITRRLGPELELEIGTPSAEHLRQLETPVRSHDPFFQQHRITWRLAPMPGGGTLVRVEQEMRTDKFLINLMPKRVLEGAEATLRELFAHLVARPEADRPRN